MDSTAKAPKAPMCFVIGQIGRDGSPERKHADLLLYAVIKEVLEAEEFGYKVKRADEDADPGMIGDRVISDIAHAELVVADLTDLNPNAFYELGIRRSTEKPTIHVARSGTQLPFDNVAHRTIFIDLTDWQSIKEGRARLAASARAINEPGFQVSNPITQANASFKMRQSADPRDRLIYELQERILIEQKRNEERLLILSHHLEEVNRRITAARPNSEVTSLSPDPTLQPSPALEVQYWERGKPIWGVQHGKDEQNEP
jgi:hypothetical protein